MGKIISSICEKVKLDKKYVLVVGSEGAGKTTLLYGSRLKPGWEQLKFIPTVGYNYEEIRTDSGIIAVFDTPGNESLFPIVKNLYKNLSISVVVYVFKISTKAIDFIISKRKLKYLVNEPELKGCALAVFANMEGNVEKQFKDPVFLKAAIGMDDVKHISPDNKKLWVFDGKHTPRESEELWEWIGTRSYDQE
jgi:GTPase SAR1 family protein